MSKTWKIMLENKLIEHYGQTDGVALCDKYNNGFSKGYMDDYSVDQAFNDIPYVERLSEKNPIQLDLYSPDINAENCLHLRIFQWKNLVSLSDIIPIVENFDLRVENERSFKVKLANRQQAWISDFVVTYLKAPFKINEVREIFHQAFLNVFSGFFENDSFNKLVLGASLSGHETIILRAYTKYLLQIGYRFSQSYIEKTLTNNTSIARQLIELFKVLHNPDVAMRKGKQSDKIEQQIIQELELVGNLDEDQIIRCLLNLIKATLRTNYFVSVQPPLPSPHSLPTDPISDARTQSIDVFAIKLNSRAIPELPLPKPLYEIFVYSPMFEAIHLRSEKIARGGIRWSERHEDFRTEILGLMKAQVVKNSIIVPSGAKGGFVLKTLPPSATQEVTRNLVVQGYKLFIKTLLSLTDNIEDNKCIHPAGVICYDNSDPYLVVAADKGTAAFSNLANDISKDYNFWLGDAFASGGSTGYDHKKMGITARGAWVSILHHFHALNFDIKNNDFSVIGIGDMSGDVFGNGMLYSKRIKLIGAFDHRHIFIDPTPDPEISYLERERMFNLPTSSWADYNTQLISKGGGVFKRNVKSITLTTEMQQLFKLEDSTLTPNELIAVMLKAPVDLLFNGGIGTFVKSSTEKNTDVSDRSNDYCRVDGNELRCKIVGEGGNLGFTQLGRVEYALTGGLIITDFIDNSAGVNCSDHEVNLKILLDSEACKGNLTQDDRNTLLTSLTHEVASHVLVDNHNQATVINYSVFSAKKNISLHTDYIKELETQGILNRRVEFLPTEKELIERKKAGAGLTRPELAILLAYTKIHLKKEILKSALPEDHYLSQIVETAFPLSIRKKYQQAMHNHPLKRDIIATQLSNEVVNNMGLTFVYRTQIETGESIEDIIRAYTIASHSFKTSELQLTIDSLELKITMEEQFEIRRNIRKLINLSTRWFLHGNYHKRPLKSVIDHYAANIKRIEKLVPELMTGITKTYFKELTDKFLKANLSVDTANHIAAYRAIYTSLNIIEVATKNKFNLEKTAKIYFAGGERMDLVWFRDQLANDLRDDYWNVLTRLTLRDELDILQRAITVAILNEDEDNMREKELIEKWVNNNRLIVARWNALLLQLHNSSTIEYTMFFIAIRELSRLLRTDQTRK